MLSREVMGVLALAILWVNALLVCGAAGKELLVVWRLWRRLRPAVLGDEGLLEGTVSTGRGDRGALASHRVEQVGRYAADDADKRAIAFSDRSYAGSVFGGVLETTHGAVQLVPAADADVWPDPVAQRRAASCPSPAEFDRAYADAKKARGFARTIDIEIPASATVWVLGSLGRGDAGEPRLAPCGDGLLLVSARDPRRFCRNKMVLLLGFVALSLLAAGACTAISLVPPHFGVVSTVGAALGLAYFLLIQPAGTAVRDRVRVPSRAVVRGSWVEGVIDAPSSRTDDAADAQAA